jgi:hypothetical protein
MIASKISHEQEVVGVLGMSKYKLWTGPLIHRFQGWADVHERRMLRWTGGRHVVVDCGDVSHVRCNQHSNYSSMQLTPRCFKV